MSAQRRIAALAARQHGIVTRAQLLGACISADVLDGQMHGGYLRPVHRGVYLVGHSAAPAHAREMAAVLACGVGALISHRSAAALWQLLPYPAQGRLVDVSVPARRDVRRPGIRVHRVRALQHDELTRLKGIPVTTPARTLLDLAAAARVGELEQAVAQAEARHLAGRRRLLALLARYPGRQGTRALKALLERDGGPALTRSVAERRFLDLVRRAQLPSPEVNVRLGPYEVDFLWREDRLVVELDGFSFHSSRAKFDADRLRDGELMARGFRVMRVTWPQIVDTPEATLVRLSRALAWMGR